MPRVQTLDQASIDRFTTELIRAGFHAIDGSDLRDWQGPTLDCFKGLSNAPTMLVHIRDGWPFVHPRIIVAGITGEHASADGVVCLWGEDDNSLEWLCWPGTVRRAEAWCGHARSGFRQVDVGLDAYIGFESVDNSAMVTFELSELLAGVSHDGKHQRIHGVLESEYHVSLHRGKGAPGTRPGRLFYRSMLLAPPRTRSELEASLTSAQLQRLRGDISRVREGDPPVDFAVLAWGPSDAADILVLRVKRDREQVIFSSMEPAPNDRRTLLLRAGRDATMMAQNKIVIFGTGAVGSDIALLLAQGGLGSEHLADGERMRPGNVTRHRAGNWAVGIPKVGATAGEIHSHAPWTVVTTEPKSLSGPEDIQRVFAGHDLIMDATGNWAFQQQIARLAASDGTPLVTAALYRGGRVGRVRRQTAGDPNISERVGGEYYLIPPDDPTSDSTLETGCSSPVSNAAPSSVAAVAALAVAVVTDHLSGRRAYPPEIVEVYEPLPDPPFDRVGRLPWPKF